MRTWAVIPARYGSTRFPGKMLAPVHGRPLVWYTYEQARRAARVDTVAVATDDGRIASALAPLGVRTVMTRVDHASGTDRIAEVVAATPGIDLVVNVQGDEPLIDPRTIDAAVEALLDHPEVPMATARRLIADPGRVADPNVVKVVCDASSRALYFSRCPIPFVRDASDRASAQRCHWQHIGLYAYRASFLLEYAAWPVTPLEQLERLEQLRALEHGCPILVVDTEYESIGVDTPEDLERVRGLIPRPR